MKRYILQYVDFNGKTHKRVYNNYAQYLAEKSIYKVMGFKIIAIATKQVKVIPGHEVDETPQDTVTLTIY